MVGWRLNVHDVLHTGRVDKKVEQQNFDDHRKDGDQVSDTVLEDGDPPRGAHVEVEHLK